MVNLLVFVLLILPVVSFSRQTYMKDLESGLFLFRAEERSLFTVYADIWVKFIGMNKRYRYDMHEAGFVNKKYLSLIFIYTSSK